MADGDLAGAPLEPRISLVTLGVADLARSRAFYMALGWQPSGLFTEGVAFFQLGPLILTLYPATDLARDAGMPVVRPAGSSGMALAYNCREQAEVDAVIARMEAAGGTVTRGAKAMDWGGYGGYVADPDGHLWEIAWNPGFPIDEAGGVHLPPG